MNNLESQIDTYKAQLADVLQQTAHFEAKVEQGRIQAHQLRGAIAALAQLLPPQQSNGLDQEATHGE